MTWHGRAPNQEPYQALCDELGFGRLREGVGRWSGKLGVPSLKDALIYRNCSETVPSIGGP